MTTPFIDSANESIFNQYTIRTERRDELQAFLKERGIGTAIYYPLPLHLQPCFAYLGYKQGSCPESERAAAEVLSLPIYPGADTGSARRSDRTACGLSTGADDSMKQRLLTAHSRTGSAVIGVIGLGYVGLPLAVEFAKAGFHVIGYDVSERVCSLLMAGESHIQDVPASEVAALVRSGLFEATTDENRARARPTRSRSPCRRRCRRRATRT